MTVNNNSITIPEELQEKLIILAEDSGYENLNEFINYFLHEIVSSAYSGMEKELVDDNVTKFLSRISKQLNCSLNDLFGS